MREFSGPSALHDAGAAYDELLDAIAAPFTCRRPWLQAWVESYPHWDPWVVVVDGAAAALARRRRGPVTQVIGLGTGPSDETRLPAVDAVAGDRLAAAVAGLLPRAWSLRVEQLPPDCPVLAGLTVRLPVVEVTAGDGLPRVDIDPARDWRTHVSRNARQADSKARRQLAEAGYTVTESRTSDPTLISAAMPDLLGVHRARDLALGRRADHDDASEAAFHAAVVAAHTGAVELIQLRASGVLAAYVLAFRDGSAFCVWDNRVNPEFQRFSAGRVANTAALKQVTDDPSYDVLDWMRGEEAYKLSSATRVDPSSELRAWSSRLLRLPYDAAARGRALRATNPLAARLFTALGKPPPRGT